MAMSEKIVLESLDDKQILEICDQLMSEKEQEKLSQLLIKQREEILNDEEQNQLSQLMAVYREGLLDKAKALQIAVEQNLINKKINECYQYQSKTFRELLNPLEPVSPEFDPEEAKWSYLKEKFNLDTSDMITVFEHISQNAQARGLTEEVLEELLTDES
jgi:hypothetical protein